MLKLSSIKNEIFPLRFSLLVLFAKSINSSDNSNFKLYSIFSSEKNIFFNPLYFLIFFFLGKNFGLLTRDCFLVPQL